MITTGPQKFWYWLIEPTSALKKLEQRRKARLVSSFLLIIIVAILLERVFGGNVPWLVTGIVVIAYCLSRTKYYFLATVLTIASLCIPSFTTIASLSSYPTSTVTIAFMWLALPLILSSLIYSTRGIIIVIVAIITSILLSPLLISKLQYQTIITALAFIGTLSVLIIIVSHQRNLIEQDRQTELRLANNTLKTSEATNRALLEAIPDGIFQLDKNGTYLNFMPAKSFKTLMPPSEFLGKSLTDTLPASLAQELMNTLQTTLQTKKTQTYEYPLTVNNQTRYYEARLSISGGDEVLGIVRDITEREQAKLALEKSEDSTRQFQEKLKTLHTVTIELSMAKTFNDLCRKAIELGLDRLGFDRLGIWLLDERNPRYRVGAFGTDETGKIRDERGQKTVIEDHTAAVYRGEVPVKYWDNLPLHSNTQEVVGNGWNALVAMWDGDKVIGCIAADNLLRQQPLGEYELELLTLYGSTIGYLCTRKRAEEQLINYATELEQSNRELQNFAYVSSHDLQEPLRKIQAFGDRLKIRYGNTLDEHGLDYLERMQSAAARMQNLIQDLLAFSRVTTQAKPFVPVNLNTVVREALAYWKTSIENTQAKIVISNLPTIPADPSQIRQLFQNLISNALKFRRADTPPVIKIQGRQQSQDFYQITVEDNGIGFDDKYADRIFGVFQRLHGREYYQGTGVGLAICRKIVERHKGTISVKSTPQQGTIFIITLPLVQEVENIPPITSIPDTFVYPPQGD